MIQIGSTCIITRDIYVQDQYVFRAGEEVSIEAVEPDPQKPESKYVVLSRSTNKRFRLSDVDLKELSADNPPRQQHYQSTAGLSPAIGSGRYQASLGLPQGSRQGRFIRTKRIIPGLLVIVVAAALVVAGLNISRGADTVRVPADINMSAEVAAANSRYSLNNLGAQSAPQQEVCNGWYTNDLLNILVTATSRTIEGNQIVAANQQMIVDSNQRLMVLIWLSVAALLFALGLYFIISSLLSN